MSESKGERKYATVVATVVASSMSLHSVPERFRPRLPFEWSRQSFSVFAIIYRFIEKPTIPTIPITPMSVGSSVVESSSSFLHVAEYGNYQDYLKHLCTFESPSVVDGYCDALYTVHTEKRWRLQREHGVSCAHGLAKEAEKNEEEYTTRIYDWQHKKWIEVETYSTLEQATQGYREWCNQLSVSAKQASATMHWWLLLNDNHAQRHTDSDVVGVVVHPNGRMECLNSRELDNCLKQFTYVSNWSQRSKEEWSFPFRTYFFTHPHNVTVVDDEDDEDYLGIDDKIAKNRLFKNLIRYVQQAILRKASIAYGVHDVHLDKWSTMLSPYALGGAKDPAGPVLFTKCEVFDFFTRELLDVFAEATGVVAAIATTSVDAATTMTITVPIPTTKHASASAPPTPPSTPELAPMAPMPPLFPENEFELGDRHDKHFDDICTFPSIAVSSPLSPLSPISPMSHTHESLFD